MKKIINFFDKLEDKVRFNLSKHPNVYALIGGVAVVLFWRGVWTFTDFFDFMTPVVSILVSVIVMLLTGTFVSFFIGEQLLMSGLKEEKRIDQKTEEELRKEERRLNLIVSELDEIKRGVEEIKNKLNNP